MRQYFRSLRFNIKYLCQAIWELDWTDIKHHSYDLWDDTIVSPLRQTWYGLENLMIWLPIIWCDRNWDHYYIRKMLRKKLVLVRDATLKYSYHTTSDQDVKRLNFCIKRLDEIEEGDFCKTMNAKHEAKYGTLKTYSFPHRYDKNGKIMSYSMEFMRSKTPHSFPELVEEERAAHVRIMEIEGRREARAYRLLGSCLGKYLPYFWS